MNLKQWAQRHGIDADPRLIEEAQAEANSLVRIPLIWRRGYGRNAIIAMTLSIAMILVAEGVRRLDSSIWVATPAIVFLFIVFAAVFSVTTRRQRMRRFRAALNRRGVFVCMDCGYFLRGLDATSRMCPECGNATGRIPKNHSS